MQRGLPRESSSRMKYRCFFCPEPTVRERTALNPVCVWGGYSRLRKLSNAQRRQQESLHKSCVSQAPSTLPAGDDMWSDNSGAALHNLSVYVGHDERSGSEPDICPAYAQPAQSYISTSTLELSRIVVGSGKTKI